MIRHSAVERPRADRVARRGFRPGDAVARPLLDVDFLSGQPSASLLPFTRAGGAAYLDADGVLKTAAANVARRAWKPAATLDPLPRGVLIEPARTNLMQYTEEFDNGYWTKTAGAVTANAATAPDGTATADKFAEDTATSVHEFYRNSILAPNTGKNTLSCFVKPAGRTAVGWLINFGGGALGAIGYDLTGAGALGSVGAPIAALVSNHRIEAWPNGWYRIMATLDTTGAAGAARFDLRLGTSPASQGSYAGDGSSGVFVWGAQAEVGAWASSYVKAGAMTVTRAADVMTLADPLRYTGNGEFTFAVEYELADDGALHDLLALWRTASPSQHFMAIYAGAGSGAVLRATSGGALVVDLQPASAAVRCAVALRCRRHDWLGVLNAAPTARDINGQVPSTLDAGQLGANYLGDVSRVWLRRFRLWNVGLSDNELRAAARTPA